MTFHLPKIVQTKGQMDDFDGPLDLIIALLQKNKISIDDLPIAALCQQFLAWIDARTALDLEVASEFITMASHLVYLKSKNLVAAGEETEEIDELKLLLEQRLIEEERKKMEVVKAFLEPRPGQHGHVIFSRLPEPSSRAKELPVLSVDKLTEALFDLFARLERKILPTGEVFAGIVGKEPYPVTDKMHEILALLGTGKRVSVRSILQNAGNRSEVVAAFLAMLEMCRNREIVFLQEDELFLALPV